MNWKEKTCQDCRFRVGENCRLNPPMVGMSEHGVQTNYPQVFIPSHTQRGYLMDPVEKPDFYEAACSKYEMEHIKP